MTPPEPGVYFATGDIDEASPDVDVALIICDLSDEEVVEEDATFDEDDATAGEEMDDEAAEVFDADDEADDDDDADGDADAPFDGTAEDEVAEEDAAACFIISFPSSPFLAAALSRGTSLDFGDTD